jgi:hypothetical protein
VDAVSHDAGAVAVAEAVSLGTVAVPLVVTRLGILVTGVVIMGIPLDRQDRVDGPHTGPLSHVPPFPGWVVQGWTHHPDPGAGPWLLCSEVDSERVEFMCDDPNDPECFFVFFEVRVGESRPVPQCRGWSVACREIEQYRPRQFAARIELIHQPGDVT